MHFLSGVMRRAAAARPASDFIVSLAKGGWQVAFDGLKSQNDPDEAVLVCQKLAAMGSYPGPMGCRLPAWARPFPGSRSCGASLGYRPSSFALFA